MENKGFISPSNENHEREVYLKKGHPPITPRTSKKESKKEGKLTDEKKAMIKELKNNHNLKNLKLLDENGKVLNANISKHIKNVLTEQFCGIGIICMGIQDAEVFFKKKNYVMNCKMFKCPSKEDLQTFVDKNKIDAAIILYECGTETTISAMQTLIPKVEVAFFAVSTPAPNSAEIDVTIIY